MTFRDDQKRPWSRHRRLATLVCVGALLGSACSWSDDDGDAPATPRGDEGPSEAPPATLAGGLELTPVEPAQVLVGTGLAFGQPLPSEQIAADALTGSPEVGAAMARRVYSLRDGRQLALAHVLSLNGAELFDQGVLDAFVRGVVAAAGDGTTEAVAMAGRTAFRSQGPDGFVMGFLEGDQLVVVRGPNEREVAVVVDRQLLAIAEGAAGAAVPVTPLAALPVDAAFVAVPTVDFQPIPPPEDEPAPDAPALPGATGRQGRYGVVAGERRTVVWAFTVDPGVYPTAEVLEPAIGALVSARAGGVAAEAVEVVDRVVQRATPADGAPSVRAFRHQGLVLLVEGADPAQVDAVVSAWITAL